MKGLNIVTHPLVNRGTFVWTRGGEVIGVGTAERAKFFGMFGLAPMPPAEADGVIMSPDDWLILEPNLNHT